MTNAAAIGYMILAARSLGYSKNQIEDIAASMYSEMDFTTEEEAEEAYRKS